MIFAIDPGNIYSAYAVLDDELKLLDFGKIENHEMLKRIEKYGDRNIHFPIEMVACYGMAVGKTVFETCLWIGRFIQTAKLNGYVCITKVYRQDEKMNLCHDSRAKDCNIRQALVDRFAKHDLKNGKGTKKNPDVFYGVSADVWAAIAVGVTYHDINMLEAKESGK